MERHRINKALTPAALGFFLATPLPAFADPAPVALFDASAIQGVANGAAVTDWPDATGHGYDATEGGHAPHLVSEAVHSLPAVRFEASDTEYLVFKRPVQGDMTIIGVFRSAQGSSDGTAYFQGAGLVQGEIGGVVSDFGVSLNEKGQILAGTGFPDTSLSSGPGFNDAKPHLFTFTRTKKSGTITLFVDGVRAATSTAGTQFLVAPATLGLGAQNDGENPFTGDLAEVQIFDTALSDAARMKVEGALKSKWGIP